MSNTFNEPMPARRSADLVARRQGSETLVLDTRSDTVHLLTADLARVWELCAPERTVADVVAATGLTAQTVSAAVSALLEKDLVNAPGGIDRRWFLRRSVLVGAGVAAAPLVIQSIAAPSAYAAGSQISGTVTQLSCSPGASGKINYQVDITNGAPNTTYYPTITYTVGSTTTTDATSAGILTNSSGTGSGTGQTSTHTGAINVTLRIYTSSAHTTASLVYTSSLISLAGC